MAGFHKTKVGTPWLKNKIAMLVVTAMTAQAAAPILTANQAMAQDQGAFFGLSLKVPLGGQQKSEPLDGASLNFTAGYEFNTGNALDTSSIAGLDLKFDLGGITSGEREVKTTNSYSLNGVAFQDEVYRSSTLLDHTTVTLFGGFETKGVDASFSPFAGPQTFGFSFNAGSLLFDGVDDTNFSFALNPHATSAFAYLDNSWANSNTTTFTFDQDTGSYVMNVLGPPNGGQTSTCTGSACNTQPNNNPINNGGGGVRG